MKILVVEDSILYQKTIVKYLKELLPGAEFVVAGNGKEGYSAYRAEKPDFILLDLLMPEITGQELLKMIREEDRDTRVVVISADVQKIVKDEIYGMGILDFINKPFTREKALGLADLIKGA